MAGMGKEKLKQKQEEFEQELNQKTKLLKPKVFGCIWYGDRESHKGKPRISMFSSNIILAIFLIQNV